MIAFELHGSEEMSQRWRVVDDNVSDLIHRRTEPGISHADSHVFSYYANRLINCLLFSAKYMILRACMLNVFENCLRGSQVEKYLENLRETVIQNFLTLIGEFLIQLGTNELMTVL